MSGSLRRRAAILAAVAAAVWLARGSSDALRGRVAPSERNASSSSAVSSDGTNERSSDSVAPGLAPTRVDADAQRILDDATASAVYPSTCRPLTPEQQHLVDYDRRYEHPAPSAVDPYARVLFTADRVASIGGDPVELLLQTSWPVHTALVEVELGAKRLPVAMTADEEGSLRGTFDPSKVEEPTVARFVATFELAPDASEERWLHVELHPERTLPARFTGDVETSIVLGSLAVDVEIAVHQPGFYVFDANLFEGDTPVAWSRFKGELDEGLTRARLSFFGKVLTDHAGGRARLGDLRLGQLRGGLLRPGRDPELARVRPLDDVALGEVRISELSASPFESAHSSRRLAKLRELAARGELVSFPAPPRELAAP
jgi:hypothetical protein